MRRRATLMVAFFLGTAAATPATAQNLELGRAVYVRDCANCHGEIEYPGGPVDPERGAFPPYYAGNRYLLNVSPVNIRTAILYGVTGTGMTGWGGDLSNEALDSLIDYIEYVRSLSLR